MCERCWTTYTELDQYGEPFIVREPVEPIFDRRGNIIGQAFCPHCQKGVKDDDYNDYRKQADSKETPQGGCEDLR